MTAGKSQIEKIVYLIGAGATQAEVTHLGVNLNLLMNDRRSLEGLARRIITKATKYKRLAQSQPPDTPVDVEHLISLLQNTGIAKHEAAASELRELYGSEILSGLKTAGVLDRFELTEHLLALHRDASYSQRIEELVGVISLNHDFLLQVAFQRVYGGVNLGFDYQSDFFTPNSNIPVLVQPHGSLNWRNDRPITVRSPTDVNEVDPEVLWIPPTILKESKDYPYNKLMGVAHELLSRCDALRIVGCRLSQNDWNIISLLFTAQLLQAKRRKSPFRIELVMSPKSGVTIKRSYGYLSGLTSIEHFKDGDFTLYQANEEEWRETQADNPFKYWLVTKTKHHVDSDGLSLTAPLRTLIE